MATKSGDGWKLVPREASDAVLECLYEDSQEAWAYLLNTTPSEPTEAMERVVELAELLVDAIIKSHRPVEIDNRTVGLHRALAALDKAMEKGENHGN